MSIGGNLRTMPFPDLLQWVSQSRKTGTLVIDGPRMSKKVYFRNGAVAAAASEDPTEFLSYFLVGWGILEERELQELLDMQDEHGTLLGELLVIVGRLSREELRRILMVKTQETIFDVFLWEEGEFRFLDNILPSKRFYALDLAVDSLTLEGVRRTDELARIRPVIPNGKWIPRLARAVEGGELGRSAGKLLPLVDGVTSIERIALAARVSEFEVLQMVFHGLQKGIFELFPPSDHGEESIPGFSKGSWRVLLKKGEAELDRGDLLRAYESVRSLRSKYGSRREIQELTTALEGRIRRAVEGRGPEDGVVLELAIPQARVQEMPFSPEEGFLLSRINGSYNLAEILNIFPGSGLEGRLLVDALLHRGVIRIKGRQDVAGDAGAPEE